jgi:hypothetical protein
MIYLISDSWAINEELSYILRFFITEVCKKYKITK